jgi:hypothetical protein
VRFCQFRVFLVWAIIYLVLSLQRDIRKPVSKSSVRVGPTGGRQATNLVRAGASHGNVFQVF